MSANIYGTINTMVLHYVPSKTLQGTPRWHLEALCWATVKKVL